MVSINRVNRNYFLRILAFPFVAISYISKFFSLRKEIKKYSQGISDLSLEERYERLFAFFERGLFLKNKTYTFVSKEKILQVQTIFIVNESFNWESIVLLREIVKRHRHLFPSFLLYTLLIRSKPSPFWKILDTRYGPKELERALKSQRSIFVEKRFIDMEPKSVSVLKDSHLPVIPIYSCSYGRNNFYMIGSILKAREIVNIQDSAFVNVIDNIFDNLEKEFKYWKNTQIKPKKSIKELFLLK